MFHTQLRSGKAFAAEQKIRELKNFLNEIISTKYGFAPETIEKRILDQKDGPYFNEIYDFVRLRKVEKKNNNKKLMGEKLC